MLKILFQIDIFVELIKKKMRIKNKIIGALIFSILFSMISFSCNPHRRGATAGQIGAGSGQKFHKQSATAKRKKTIKY